MAQITLYIDVADGSLVSSTTNSAAAPTPVFTQGDTIAMRIYLLERTSTYPFSSTPFSIMSTSGLTLQVALGTKVGSSTTLYATQYSWDGSGGNNSYWAAQFALNTTEITTLLGSAASVTAFFEVKYLSGGLPTTVLNKQITINAATIKGTPTPLGPGQTSISAETANATFLTRSITGAVIFSSPDGTKRVALWVDNDGTFHSDPVT